MKNEDSTRIRNHFCSRQVIVQLGPSLASVEMLFSAEFRLFLRWQRGKKVRGAKNTELVNTFKRSGWPCHLPKYRIPTQLSATPTPADERKRSGRPDKRKRKQIGRFDHGNKIRRGLNRPAKRKEDEPLPAEASTPADERKHRPEKRKRKEEDEVKTKAQTKLAQLHQRVKERQEEKREDRPEEEEDSEQEREKQEAKTTAAQVGAGRLQAELEEQTKKIAMALDAQVEEPEQEVEEEKQEAETGLEAAVEDAPRKLFIPAEEYSMLACAEEVVAMWEDSAMHCHRRVGAAGPAEVGAAGPAVMQRQEAATLHLFGFTVAQLHQRVKALDRSKRSERKRVRRLLAIIAQQLRVIKNQKRIEEDEDKDKGAPDGN